MTPKCKISLIATQWISLGDDWLAKKYYFVTDLGIMLQCGIMLHHVTIAFADSCTTGLYAS